MRFSASSILPVLCLGGMAAAQHTDQPSALVNVQVQSGGTPVEGAGGNMTIPLDEVYTGDVFMEKVSKLSLIGSKNAELEAITCQPYKGTEGTGVGGLPFDRYTPSHLSTNTVVVGSIVCTEEK